MTVVNLKDRTIYRASKGKKVKFVNSDIKFNEIVVRHGEDAQVEEVNE